MEDGMQDGGASSATRRPQARLDEIVIHSGPLSMFGAKAEMAAIEKGIEWRRVFVPFSIGTLYEPKSEVVLRVNPKAQVPVLVHGDLEIFDSTQIFEYLEDLAPEPPLWPRDPRARARARLLELKSDEVFFPDVVLCMPGRRAEAGEAAHAAAAARIQRYLEQMDVLLRDRDHLAGPFGFADLAFYAAQFFARFLGQPPARTLIHLEAWRARMNERESVRRVMGAMAEYLTHHGLATSIDDRPVQPTSTD
jgi:glutathione S-transferase